VSGVPVQRPQHGDRLNPSSGREHAPKADVALAVTIYAGRHDDDNNHCRANEF